MDDAPDPDGGDCVACGRCCHHGPSTVHLLESDDAARSRAVPTASRSCTGSPSSTIARPAGASSRTPAIAAPRSTSRSPVAFRASSTTCVPTTAVSSSPDPRRASRREGSVTSARASSSSARAERLERAPLGERPVRLNLCRSRPGIGLPLPGIELESGKSDFDGVQPVVDSPIGLVLAAFWYDAMVASTDAAARSAAARCDSRHARSVSGLSAPQSDGACEFAGHVGAHQRLVVADRLVGDEDDGQVVALASGLAHHEVECRLVARDVETLPRVALGAEELLDSQ